MALEGFDRRRVVEFGAYAEIKCIGLLSRSELRLVSGEPTAADAGEWLPQHQKAKRALTVNVRGLPGWIQSWENW